MVYRPRLIMTVIPNGTGNELIIPTFQVTIDSVVGITADWISAQIINTNNRFDWIFDGIDTHEIRIYEFLSELPITATYQQIQQEADGHCIFHGWFGPTSKTIGSEIKNIISVKGGDAAYMLNKRHPGDYMKRETYASKATGQQDRLIKAMSGWSILQEIMRLDPAGNYTKNDPDYKKNSFDRISVKASSTFRDNKQVLSGFVLPDTYNPPDLLADETKAAVKKQFYQTNNASILEIIDDICVKTGFNATVFPGTKDILIYKNDDEYKELVRKNYDLEYKKHYTNNLNSPITLYTSSSLNNLEPLRTCMYCKIAKYPGYEDGIKMNMRHWDWEQSNASGTLGLDHISATASFEGNPEKDAFVQVLKMYEKIPLNSLKAKVVRALSRIVCNRITGYIGLPGGDNTIMSGKTFTLKGAGFFSGDYQTLVPLKPRMRPTHSYLGEEAYYITSTRRNFSAIGYTNSISFRLKDLTESSPTLGHNPYTTYVMETK